MSMIASAVIGGLGAYFAATESAKAQKKSAQLAADSQKYATDANTRMYHESRGSEGSAILAEYGKETEAELFRNAQGILNATTRGLGTPEEQYSRAQADLAGYIPTFDAGTGLLSDIYNGGVTDRQLAAAKPVMDARTALAAGRKTSLLQAAQENLNRTRAQYPGAAGTFVQKMQLNALAPGLQAAAGVEGEAALLNAEDMQAILNMRDTLGLQYLNAPYERARQQVGLNLIPTEALAQAYGSQTSPFSLFNIGVGKPPVIPPLPTPGPIPGIGQIASSAIGPAANSVGNYYANQRYANQLNDIYARQASNNQNISNPNYNGYYGGAQYFKVPTTYQNQPTPEFQGRGGGALGSYELEPMAKGGGVEAGGNYLTGEEGPEVFVPDGEPDQGGTQWPRTYSSVHPETWDELEEYLTDEEKANALKSGPGPGPPTLGPQADNPRVDLNAVREETNPETLQRVMYGPPPRTSNPLIAVGGMGSGSNDGFFNAVRTVDPNVITIPLGGGWMNTGRDASGRSPVDILRSTIDSFRTNGIPVDVAGHSLGASILYNLLQDMPRDSNVRPLYVDPPVNPPWRNAPLFLQPQNPQTITEASRAGIGSDPNRIDFTDGRTIMYGPGPISAHTPWNNTNAPSNAANVNWLLNTLRERGSSTNPPAAVNKPPTITYPSYLTPLPPGRARGGPVGRGRSYVVGERGPEIFVPRQRGTIIPNHRLLYNPMPTF